MTSFWNEPTNGGEMQLVPAGTRPRSVVWRQEAWCTMKREVPFSHYSLMFEQWESSTLYEVSLIDRIPFEKRFSSDEGKWRLNCAMTVTDLEGEILDKMTFFIDSRRPIYQLETGSFEEETVFITLELGTSIGLGLEPLFDYSVPSSLSDVTCVVEGKRFHLNKMFLAENSSFFAHLLCGGSSWNGTDDIILYDVPAEDFENCFDVLTQQMHHIYNTGALLAAFRCADRFGLTAVFERIREFLLIFHDWFSMRDREILWQSGFLNF